MNNLIELLNQASRILDVGKCSIKGHGKVRNGKAMNCDS
jgi:hypothetical protein